jgi:HEAT repeat protein
MTRYLLSALGFFLLSCSVNVKAETGNVPLVDQLVTASDVVAVMRVVSVVPVPAQMQDGNKGPAIIDGGAFKLSIVRSIKGEPPSTLAIDFPPQYPDPFPQRVIKIQPGENILVFLNKGNAGYEPASTEVPFYPVILPSSLQDGQADPLAVVHELLDVTLAAPRFREFTAYALIKVRGPDVVLAMSKYIDDPDESVKSDALSCMAVNSQVAAIPMIVKYAKSLLKEGRIPLPAFYLSQYTLKGDAPYLNPLVWSDSSFIRVQALRALYASADQSSAPYLILALRDPTPNFEAAAGARLDLAKNILKDIQPDEDTSQFAAHYNSEVQVFYDWWSDELQGKHLASDDPDVTKKEKEAESQTIPTDVQDINPLLFQPYPALRERAIVALAHKADRSSIPYLVLALQDPDGDVSYNAYVNLRRLLGVSGNPFSETDYSANQADATKPLYAWWSNEMLGKHMVVSTQSITGSAPPN